MAEGRGPVTQPGQNTPSADTMNSANLAYITPVPVIVTPVSTVVHIRQCAPDTYWVWPKLSSAVCAPDPINYTVCLLTNIPPERVTNHLRRRMRGAGSFLDRW
jgi:hypothetical protein